MTAGSSRDADLLLGVDVGGTFTDAVLVGQRGQLWSAKTPTTPDPADGVFIAIARVLGDAGSDSTISRFAHGTTVATNALIQRAGVPTAAIFTNGFGDLLELRRQNRAKLYLVREPHPEPLVDRQFVIEAHERMLPEGVHIALEESEIDRICRAVDQLDVASVAICLLHAYIHPRHERQLMQALHERSPDLHVVASHEITQDLREYERACTTIVDATLTPVVAPYLDQVAARSADAGLPAPLVMQSSGGLDRHEAVAAHTVRAVLSGPAGGIVAAERLAAALDRGVLCCDVGGTSCDVAVVGAGDIARSTDRRVAGVPLQIDMVDMDTVGAGGSSIVWVDAAGELAVGPQSAGANPGPASFGRGGTRFTVTDAHLLAGSLDPACLARWGVDADIDAARNAAAELDIDADAEEIAVAALHIATANMARSARLVSVARGHDPAQLVFLPYGGAGGLHACDVAAAVGCPRIAAPLEAGVFSALGLAIAPERRELTRWVRLECPVGHRWHVPAGVVRWLKHTWAMLDLGSKGANRCIRAGMSFEGQAHTIDITVPLADGLDDVLNRATVLFRQAHDERFGFVPTDRAVTVKSFSAIVEVPVDWRPLAGNLDSSPGFARLLQGEPVQLADGRAATRHDLPTGMLVIPDGWKIADVMHGCIFVDWNGDEL